MVKSTDRIPPWYDLAIAALDAAMAEDWPQLGAVLLQLGNQHHDEWPQILQAFCDAALYAQGVPHTDYGPHRRVTPIEVRTLQLGGATMNEGQVWAGALIASRIRDDRDAFYELLSQIRTNDQATHYITQLLGMVGLTVRTALQHGHVGGHEGGSCEH